MAEGVDIIRNIRKEIAGCSFPPFPALLTGKTG
jgi:hypothetical protein